MSLLKTALQGLRGANKACLSKPLCLALQKLLTLYCKVSRRKDRGAVCCWRARPSLVLVRILSIAYPAQQKGLLLHSCTSCTVTLWKVGSPHFAIGKQPNAGVMFVSGTLLLFYSLLSHCRYSCLYVLLMILVSLFRFKTRVLQILLGLFLKRSNKWRTRPNSRWRQL